MFLERLELQMLLGLCSVSEEFAVCSFCGAFLLCHRRLSGFHCYCFALIPFPSHESTFASFYWGTNVHFSADGSLTRRTQTQWTFSTVEWIYSICYCFFIDLWLYIFSSLFNNVVLVCTGAGADENSGHQVWGWPAHTLLSETFLPGPGHWQTHRRIFLHEVGISPHHNPNSEHHAK